ncbi:MAG TPA: hypothetical protein HPP87_09560 [Planctomycetes bacterium]|nr:hypothetical protein [Planctomycetota bacterium]HIJ71592.1 hypothetical protein [Planctomycetota bacterium]
MLAFSNDVDVLKYEAILFSDLYFAWQVLCEGRGGAISGTTFTASGADFISAGVGAGGVIYLRTEDGTLDGVYEIVSVNSATELTISILRADSSESPVWVAQASDVTYRVSTFGPQANQVGFELTQYFGIQPGSPDSDYDTSDILDTAVLQHVSVYGVLAKIYATLSNGSEDDSFGQKSWHYQRLYEKAKERCRVGIDINGDGVADTGILGGSVRLVRD